VGWSTEQIKQQLSGSRDPSLSFFEQS